MIAPGKVGHCAQCGDWRLIIDGKGHCFACAEDVTETDEQLEHRLRWERTCRGCGQDKKMDGLLVCWTCMKRHDVQPLAYAGMTVRDWLNKYGRGTR